MLYHELLHRSLLEFKGCREKLLLFNRWNFELKLELIVLRLSNALVALTMSNTSFLSLLLFDLIIFLLGICSNIHCNNNKLRIEFEDITNAKSYIIFPVCAGGLKSLLVRSCLSSTINWKWNICSDRAFKHEERGFVKSESGSLDVLVRLWICHGRMNVVWWY